MVTIRSYLPLLLVLLAILAPTFASGWIDDKGYSVHKAIEVTRLIAELSEE